jgi:hypothetical protein
MLSGNESCNELAVQLFGQRLQIRLSYRSGVSRAVINIALLVRCSDHSFVHPMPDILTVISEWRATFQTCFACAQIAFFSMRNVAHCNTRDRT